MSVEGCAPTAARRLRARRIVAALRRAYPDAGCALAHRNPLQLLVATILSAQCTDARVNQVTPALFARFPAAEDFAKAGRRELERMVRSTGFYRNKARAIHGACRMIVERHGGSVPRTMEELLELPGVARKTANVVLGTAYGIPSGFVVDTHVSRLAGRMGLTAHTDPVKIEADLVRLVPRDGWIVTAHRLIRHGRRVCRARRPACEACPVARLCPAAFSFGGNGTG